MIELVVTTCDYEMFPHFREFGLSQDVKTVAVCVCLSWRMQDVRRCVIRRWQLNTHPISCNSPPSNGVFHVNLASKHAAAS